MALAIRNRREYNGCEIVIERPDGSRVTGLAHANPIWDAEGNLVGAINVLVDITERREMEDRLRAADRQKDQFLAMLAHELRNPLAPIVNAAHVLHLRAADDPVVQRQRETIERNARHLSRMVDDLLEVSRINEGKIELQKERLDLVTIVEQAVDCVRSRIEEREHSVSVSVPLQPVYLQADAVRLIQILVNLLDNAVKYTDRGGQITLTASHHGEAAVLSVRDNGRGIPEEQLGTIFDLFVQGDRALTHSDAGLGIGLTLVRRLVELHGGEITVQSAGASQGSEFTIRLPAEPAPARKRRENGASPHADEASPQRRVLLVEDSVDAAETLADLLDLWGHDVRVVHDLEMAKSILDDYRPEVILLNIGFQNLGEFQISALTRPRDLRPPVVIALAWSGESVRGLGSEPEVYHQCITKPVDPQALRKALAAIPIA
jgi:signal transduction histidine kinase/CheY-like chemotaxis protein